MSDKAWTVHIDGAARGNPGPAAYSFVLGRPQQAPLEEYGTLGQTTNNVAEYSALLNALERALELKGRHLVVYSDSELLVKQMNGEYRVKNEDLKALYDEAQSLVRQFEDVRLHHIRREQNKRADALCNQALDGEKKKQAPTHAPTAPAGLEDKVRADAVECLQTAAAAWARGNAKDPPPEAVWEQIWNLVEEAGILKKAKK